MDFFPQVEINEAQAEGIARGLYTVARVDGVHEREVALISQFYAATTDLAADLNALERAPKMEGAQLAAQLPSKELRQLFLPGLEVLDHDAAGGGAPRQCDIHRRRG